MSEKLYESYSCSSCGMRFDKKPLGKANKEDYDEHQKRAHK